MQFTGSCYNNFDFNDILLLIAICVVISSVFYILLIVICFSSNKCLSVSSLLLFMDISTTEILMEYLFISMFSLTLPNIIDV